MDGRLKGGIGGGRGRGGRIAWCMVAVVVGALKKEEPVCCVMMTYYVDRRLSLRDVRAHLSILQK